MYNEKDLSPCPNPLATPKEKAIAKTYGLPYAKYIHSSYMKYGSRDMFWHHRFQATELIKLAQGMQDVNIFKPIMNVTDVKNGTPINIDWEIVNYATKLVNVAKGMLVNETYDCNLKALDPLALNQKKEFANRLKNFVKNKKFIEALGITTEFHNVENLPQSNEETEVYMNMDYKQDYCMSMEKLIKLILSINNYEQLKDEQALDLLCQGVIAAWEEIDSNGIIKLNYLDPRKVIVPPSKFPDFRDVNYGGYLEEYSIHDLRQMWGNQFTDIEYADMATNYKGGDSKNLVGLNRDQQDMSKVSVMHFYFISDNEAVFEKGTNKFGNKVFGRTDYSAGTSSSFKAEEDENGIPYKTNGDKKIYRDKYKVIYEGRWVVGSEYVANYGLKTNMERIYGNLVDVVAPLRLYAPNMKDGRVVPLVKQMRTKLNSLQRLNLKLQNAIASAIPKGMRINLNALRNVNIKGANGVPMNEMQLISMYKQSGIIVYEDTDSTGMPGAKPFEEIENGMARDVLNFLNLIQAELASLNDIIGTNSITNASTPSSDMLVGVAQASQQATNNAFTFLFNAQRWMYKNTCSSIANLAPDSIKLGGGKLMAEAIGELSIDTIGDMSEIGLHQYGIEIMIKPNAAEWQTFYAQISAAVEKGTISMSDMFFIQLIDNMKEARQVFLIREKKKAQADAQAKDQDVKNNMMAQQASNDQAHKNKIGELTTEGQVKSALVDKEMQRDKMLHQYKMEEIRETILLQGVADSKLAEQASQHSVEDIRTQSEEQAHQIVLQGEVDKSMPQKKAS